MSLRPTIPHAIPTHPDPTPTRNPQDSNNQTSNHETHPRELHAKLLGRRAWPGFETTHPATRQHTRHHRCEGRRRVRRARAGFEIDHSEPQARVWRSRGRPGPTAPGTPAEPQATTRGADGERAGRPRGGRRSVGGGSDNCRNHSPARRSTSCMMRPHTALTHATAETPRTRERQGRICRKSSKP